MTQFFQDLRYGARMLARSPAFAILAVLTLALGIGGNTAMFSVVNAVLLRPFPYPNPGGVIVVWETFASPQGRGLASLCVPRFVAWREQNKVFDGLAMYESRGVILEEGDTPIRLNGFAVTTDLFRILGIEPLLGRAFLEGEDQAGRDQVVVLSHGLWQRRFAGSRELVGKTIALRGGSYTVVGVMPPAFQFPPEARAELWVPLTYNAKQTWRHTVHNYMTVARLKPGVTLAQARSQMETLTRNLEQGVDLKSANGVRLHPLLDLYVGEIRPVLWVLCGAVAFVLLIACANVSNLLLARAAGRRVEVAVRTALGAGRSRLVRQFLTESLILAVAGAALGLLLSAWLVDLVKLSPVYIARIRNAGVDLWVLGFCAAASVLATVIFGLVPALQATKTDLQQALKEAGRGGAGGRRRLPSVLVVAEVSLTLVLLIGAGLLMRSLLRLQHVDPGFNPERLLTMRVPLARAKYPTNQTTVAFYEQLLEQVGSLPAMRASGLISRMPPNDWGSNGGFPIRGRPPVAAADLPFAEFRFVSANYFSAMGIPLRRGRFFTAQDRQGAPCVRIINESLARRYWPNEDPVGAQIEQGEWCTIVGVVADIRNAGLAEKTQPELYIPYLQCFPDWRLDNMYLLLRTAVEPNSMIAAVRAEISKLDKQQPLFNIRTMEQTIAASIQQPRFRAVVIGSFASVALLLAIIGLYGVISYEVSQRTHEIGIRMAMGAERAQVLKMVVGRGLLLASMGVVLGLLGAFALTRVIASFLFETSPTDPGTFVGISVLVAAVAVIAAYIPARRAASVDPMVALRYE